MQVLDSQGRLFGKVSVIDLGAIAAIVAAIVGIFFFPGTTGSVAQLGGTQPLEADVMVQGLRVLDPDALLVELETAATTDFIIRNQPYGQVELKGVQRIPHTVEVVRPDGSVTAVPDPRPEQQFSTTWIVTVGGDAQLTDSGPVLGNNKIKIGTPVELEGRNYNFRGSVIAVRLLE